MLSHCRHCPIAQVVFLAFFFLGVVRIDGSATASSSSSSSSKSNNKQVLHPNDHNNDDNCFRDVLVTTTVDDDDVDDSRSSLDAQQLQQHQPQQQQHQQPLDDYLRCSKECQQILYTKPDQIIRFTIVVRQFFPTKSSYNSEGEKLQEYELSKVEFERHRRCVWNELNRLISPVNDDTSGAVQQEEEDSLQGAGNYDHLPAQHEQHHYHLENSGYGGIDISCDASYNQIKSVLHTTAISGIELQCIPSETYEEEEDEDDYDEEDKEMKVLSASSSRFISWRADVSTDSEPIPTAAENNNNKNKNNNIAYCDKCSEYTTESECRDDGLCTAVLGQRWTPTSTSTTPPPPSNDDDSIVQKQQQQHHQRNGILERGVYAGCGSYRYCSEAEYLAVGLDGTTCWLFNNSCFPQDLYNSEDRTSIDAAGCTYDLFF